MCHTQCMSVINEYLATLDEPKKALLAHMYDVVRDTIAETSEEVSYGMPAFKWRGKGVVAILANKDFCSLYPFCNLDRLGLSIDGFETTKGSIHFSQEHPIPDTLLIEILQARQQQIIAASH